MDDIPLEPSGEPPPPGERVRAAVGRAGAKRMLGEHGSLG